MLKGRSVVAIIPARGGSKGFPGKNLALLGGVSLVGRAIEAARSSRVVDRVVLSTDSEAIAAEGRRIGAEVPFLRPAELAEDTTPSAAVIKHLIETLRLSSDTIIVLLQPTSPLRSAEDIDGCLERLAAGDASACVSVTAIDKPPHWIFTLSQEHRLQPIMSGKMPTRRQDAEIGYLINGAVYAIQVGTFLASGTMLPPSTLGYEMPTWRSIDIDSIEDLAQAAILLEGAFDRSTIG